MTAPGTLYICATPIGNLSDLSPRVLETLKKVGLIAAEDTRQTMKILNKFGIKTPLISYWQHNERPRTAELIAKLQAGTDIALTSDAGTPGISDPGYFLIREAAAAGFNIVPLPGPSAFLLALVASGMPAEEFVFIGFLPSAKSDRLKKLQGLVSETRTMVLYEAPHRLVKTLADLLAVLGDRPICSGRELTKKFETIQRGLISDLIKGYQAQKPRGEFTLVLAGRDWQYADDAAGPWQNIYQPGLALLTGPRRASRGDEITDLTPDQKDLAIKLAKALAPHLPAAQAAKLVADITGLERDKAYQAVLEQKQLVAKNQDLS